MALTSIIAKILAPIISIKHPEVFQIAASLPVPQPSTLVGALGYSLGAFSGSGLSASDQAKNFIAAARARLSNGGAIVNSIVLRRFRILDKGFEKGDFPKAYEYFLQGDFLSFRKIIETELTDALYREYVSQAVLKCIWVIREPIDHRIFQIIQRLGDTESLVTVLETWSAECFLEESTETSTTYPFAMPKDNHLIRISGDYVLTKMQDENSEKKLFYIPCRREIGIAKDGSKYTAYVPTSLSVKFAKPVRIFRVDSECIIGG